MGVGRLRWRKDGRRGRELERTRGHDKLGEAIHAEHQGQQGKFDLEGKMIAGNIHSKTALRLIRRWASVHRQELQANWKRMKGGRPLEGIEPLP